MFNKKALLAAAILLGTAGGLVACGGEKENPNDNFDQNETFVPSVEDPNTWGLAGSMNGWGENEVKLTKRADGKSEVTHEFAVGDEFKIRTFGAWNGDYGFGAIANIDELSGAFVDAGGNIKCAVAGTYTIVVDYFASKALTITPAN